MQVSSKVIASSATLVALFMFVVSISGGSVKHSNAAFTQTQEESSEQKEEEIGRFNPLENEQEDEQEEWEEEDEVERQEEDDWEDEDQDRDFDERIEVEYRELEFERAGVESNIGRLELITRLSDIASNDAAMAAYAIMHISEFLEPEDAVELLESIQGDENVSEAKRNLVKMKLAEIYDELGQIEKVKEVLKSMLQ